MTDAARLPRMAYVGEVPVRNLSAGPALLYRLLESYPADRLAVVESDHNPVQRESQLPDVPSRRFFLFRARFLNTRLGLTYARWVYGRAPARGAAALRQLRGWRPEAILGVAHGFGWRAAAGAAQAAGVPLHLIVHDAWQWTQPLPVRLGPRAERDFGAVYRGAASRLPVSPQMEELYRQRYGAAGVILYPSRRRDALALAEPPRRLPDPSGFRFAFAGSAPSAGMREGLVALAHAAAPWSARLRVYQNLTRDDLVRVGLQTDNVEFRPFLPVDALHRELAAEVDAMYLPMSYAPEDRENVRVCFPSKLTDYTVPGLPILIRAPEYGTAVRWAADHPGAAETVTDPGAQALTAAVGRLIGDAQLRARLAAGALATGHRLFSQPAVFENFAACLTSSPS